MSSNNAVSAADSGKLYRYSSKLFTEFGTPVLLGESIRSEELFVNISGKRSRQSAFVSQGERCPANRLP